MSEQNIVNNDANGIGTSCDGPTSGRCPMDAQRGPGRHPATAKKRTKWSREENMVLFECYRKSEANKRNYRKRLHQIWKNTSVRDEVRNVSEQRLCDQLN